MTKEEVIAAINECAGRLGNPPTSTELRRYANLNKYDIRKTFGTYGKALDACGMEAQGAGYEVKLKTLFLGWAEAVRRLGKVPTMEEYDKRSKNSVRPLIRRAGSWTRVPLLMMEFAKREGWKGSLRMYWTLWRRIFSLPGRETGHLGHPKTCFCALESWLASPCMESLCLILR